jgi:hypothetical protein
MDFRHGEPLVICSEIEKRTFSVCRLSSLISDLVTPSSLTLWLKNTEYSGRGRGVVFDRNVALDGVLILDGGLIVDGDLILDGVLFLDGVPMPVPRSPLAVNVRD